MKHLKLSTTVAAMALMASAAQAEVKVAQDCPPDPETCGTFVWANTFAEHLNANGMEAVEYARGALGDEAERLDQVSSGLLEISMSDQRSAGSIDPFIYGMGLPFLFGQLFNVFDIATAQSGCIDGDIVENSWCRVICPRGS